MGGQEQSGHVIVQLDLLRRRQRLRGGSHGQLRLRFKRRTGNEQTKQDDHARNEQKALEKRTRQTDPEPADSASCLKKTCLKGIQLGFGENKFPTIGFYLV